MRSLAVLFCVLFAVAAPGNRLQDRILIYTHNGRGLDAKGYVHMNIPAAVTALRELAASANIETEVSDDPGAFTNANLRRFKAIVFADTNNEAFDSDAQREAFRKFVSENGGVVGIHSATGSERDWPYFQSVMGGKFRRHPKLQKFTIRVVDPAFPATRALPATFTWDDECYYHDKLNSDIKVLLAADPAQLEDPKLREDPPSLVSGMIPLAWYHEFGGGREYYVALGHKDEHYKQPLFRQLLLGGIRWAIGAERYPPQ